MPIATIREFILTKIDPAFNDFVTDAALSQLEWSIYTSNKTPERSALPNLEDPNYTEVRRAISRLYCLHLLTDPDPTQLKSNYEKFISNQVKLDPFLPPLTFEAFQVLSQEFRPLDLWQKEALITSTLISSVTLSPEAKEAAQKLMGSYPQDSVEFLAKTFEDIEIAKKIYPLVADLFTRAPKSEHARLSGFLQAAFSSKQHFRHMLYTEGGNSMFTALRNKIKAHALSKEDFLFWQQHWITNITGFRGHIKPQGSLYLTQNTFKAIQALRTELEKLYKDPPYDILPTYLTTRASWLGLSVRYDLNDVEKQLLGHIGSMLRLFSPSEGIALAAAYQSFPPLEKSRIEKQFRLIMEDTDSPTPTYAPALFDNALIFVQNRDKYAKTAALPSVIRTCLPLYVEALIQYQNLRSEGKLNLDTPLCFREIAGKEAIAKILEPKPEFSTQAALMIDSDGLIHLSFPTPKPIFSSSSSAFLSNPPFVPQFHEASKGAPKTNAFQQNPRLQENTPS